jgi:DNA (cytosine-5)-methyltransferase 1
MVTRLQGWRDEWGWRFSGRKTARYRQIGNAFPPPVAEAVGTAIRRALEHALEHAPYARDKGAFDGAARVHVHDPVFRVLRSRDGFLTARQIAEGAGLDPGAGVSLTAVLGRLRYLGQDFELEIADSGEGPAYRLGGFKAFLGQREHARHARFAAGRATIS